MKKLVCEISNISVLFTDNLTGMLSIRSSLLGIRMHKLWNLCSFRKSQEFHIGVE